MFDLALAWAAARRFAQAIAALYGAAGDLAQRVAISAGERRDLKARLESLEALARKLLFLQARALPAIPVKPTRPSGERKSVRVASEATAGHDARDWRVGFRFIPRPARAHAQSNAVRPARRPSLNLNGLARRVEALSRVLADPLAAAKRLRRRLANVQDCAARLLLDNPRQDRCASEHRAARDAIYLTALRPDSS